MIWEMFQIHIVLDIGIVKLCMYLMQWILQFIFVSIFVIPVHILLIVITGFIIFVILLFLLLHIFIYCDFSCVYTICKSNRIEIGFIDHKYAAYICVSFSYSC